MIQAPPLPGELIPIFGMLTGTVMTLALGFTVYKLAQGPVGQAIARRIQGRHGDPELQHEVGELRERMTELENRLQEAEERVDFTERLLAQHRVEAQLPPGGLR